MGYGTYGDLLDRSAATRDVAFILRPAGPGRRERHDGCRQDRADGRHAGSAGRRGRTDGPVAGLLEWRAAGQDRAVT